MTQVDVIGSRQHVLGDGIGYVELVDYMASDLKVVNAARVSYQKHSSELSERDKKLINYLMENRHTSPFEHAVFQFRVKCPLFTFAQWRTHRWSSFNSQSGRWSKFDHEFYCPNETVKALTITAFDYYEALLARGEPKEQARMVLPQNIYTSFYWTVNASSLLNFLSLRNDDHAQEEIREYALAVERYMSMIMPVTYAAFERFGRVPPKLERE